jgi:hypothetical protein
MSIADLTQVSDVEILKFSDVKSPNMDLRRLYKVDRVLKCRCVGISSYNINDQLVRSGVITHKIFFGVDPGPLDERNRLRIDGCFFRPVGLPINSNMLNLMWIVFADSKTIDNENIEVI